MAKSELYERCTPAEKAKVDALYEKLKPISAEMAELHMYTRPAGKATLPWEEAKAKEDRYVELEQEAYKLNAAIRRIYKKYAQYL